MIVLLAEPGGSYPSDRCFEKRVLFVEHILRRAFFALPERAGWKKALIAFLHFKGTPCRRSNNTQSVVAAFHRSSSQYHSTVKEAIQCDAAFALAANSGFGAGEFVLVFTSLAN